MLKFIRSKGSVCLLYCSIAMVLSTPTYAQRAAHGSLILSTTTTIPPAPSHTRFKRCQKVIG